MKYSTMRYPTFVILVLFLVSSCNACSSSTSSGGCCYEIGSCTTSNDCDNQVAAYLVGLGYSSAPNGAESTCYQSNCLFYTPSTSCGTIDPQQAGCTDGDYCVNTFASSLPSSSSTKVQSPKSNFDTMLLFSYINILTIVFGFMLFFV